MRNLIYCLAAGLMSLGCATAYDPSRLDALYGERARIQETIQNIETRHGIPSRDPGIQRQREEKHAADLAALKVREEADKQKAQFEMELLAKQANEEATFLASLTPEQRLQWRMHRDRMEQERMLAEFAKSQSKARAKVLKEMNERDARRQLIDDMTRSGQRFSNLVRTSGEIMIESQKPTVNVNINEQQ